MTNDHHGDDGAHERGIDELLAIRKPGAHLDEEVVADDFVLMLGVDLNDPSNSQVIEDDFTFTITGPDGQKHPVRMQAGLDGNTVLGTIWSDPTTQTQYPSGCPNVQHCSSGSVGGADLDLQPFTTPDGGTGAFVTQVDAKAKMLKEFFAVNAVIINLSQMSENEAQRMNPLPPGAFEALFPRALRRRKILRRQAAEIARLVAYNAERLRWTLLQGGNDALRRLDADIGRTIDTAITTTTDIVARVRKQRDQAATALPRELERRRATIVESERPEWAARGYARLFHDTITQADDGCDFDFLRGDGKS